MAFTGMAQSEQYKSGMKGMLAKMNAANNSPEAYQDVSNGFMRIAGAEKAEWLPKYYASFSLIMQAMFTKDKEKIDAILDQADRILSEVSTTVTNDEVLCLQAFSKSTRIGVDPAGRGMRYGMESSKFLSEAKGRNPENPRVYFLQGQAAFHTPEAFGGGKKAAKELFQTAVEKYAAEKPANELMPTWGKDSAVKMLAECNK